MKNRLLLLAFLVKLFPLFAFAQSQNIVQTAEGAGSFKTLLAAIRAAGLASTLSGDGPFTVFAPTDAAFAKLPQGTLQSLLKPENKDRLRAILTYHVVSGRVGSDALLTTSSATTVNGAPLPIGLTVQNARVVQADIAASNGVIHVIDAVLIPPSEVSAARGGTKKTHNNNTDQYRRDEYHSWQQREAGTGFRRAKNRIEQSIAKGSEAYNKGDAAGCAAIYMQTARTLIANEPLTNDLRMGLENALTTAQHAKNASDRAWTMRRALETVYEGL